MASLCFASSDKECSLVFLSTNPAIKPSSLESDKKSPIVVDNYLNFGFSDNGVKTLPNPPGLQHQMLGDSVQKDVTTHPAGPTSQTATDEAVQKDIGLLNDRIRVAFCD